MKYLIIGSGPGGIFGAEAIRRRDADSPVTLVSAEGTIAHSPVMITYWIGGEIPRQGLYFRDSSWAEQHRIELKLGQRVLSLQTECKKLTLKSGEEISYDRLLIASGSSPVSLPIPGVMLKGVHSLRQVSDAEGILAEMANLRQVIIIGGGFIGLKLAGHLKERGISVLILEKETRLAPRMFDDTASLFLADLLGREGIRVETGVEVEEVLGKAGWVCGVRMRDGRILPGQMVIQSVGVRPNTEFLAGSEITVEGGIPVNARMETTIAGVYAAGDVAITSDSITGEIINNASWPAASRQGTVAGTNMAGGNISCTRNFSSNAFYLCGVPVMAAGNSSETNGQSLMEKGSGFYRKILLKGGRLSGFMLIGKVSQAGILLALMKKKETVSGAELLQERYFWPKSLPQGYGYRHGSLFLKSKLERS